MQLAEEYAKKEDFQMKGPPRKIKEKILEQEEREREREREREVYILVQEDRPRVRL